MRGQVRTVAGTGFLVAVGILLFPSWLWTSPGSDCIDCYEQHSFVSRPPTQYAHVDLMAMECWELANFTLTIGILFFLQQRSQDEKAVAYWRTKWDYAKNNPDTLLRASDKSVVRSEVLLRAVIEFETPKEELLRVAKEG